MSKNFLTMPVSDFYISELFKMSDNIINKRSTRHLIINKALLQTDAYW